MELIDSIDRRLAFLREEYNRGMPPMASRNALPPSTRHSRSSASSRRRYLMAGTIAATKKERELMRTVSGLGMEDPVFGTIEEGPMHPSNIFDDMSLGDLPEDLRDMISIASDPTAQVGDGIDEEIFHSSLGDLRAPIPKHTLMEKTFRKKKPIGSLKEEEEEDESVSLGDFLALGMEEIQPLEPSAQGSTKPLLPVEGRLKRSDAQTTRQMPLPSLAEPTPSPTPKPSVHLLEKLNASIQSLPSLCLEDALAGIQSPPQTPSQGSYEDKLHKSKSSFISATSKTSQTTASESEEAKSPVAQPKPTFHWVRKDKTGTADETTPKRRNHAEDETMFQVFSRNKRKEMNKVFVPPLASPYASTKEINSNLSRGDSIYQPSDPNDFDPRALPAMKPVTPQRKTNKVSAAAFSPSGLHRKKGIYQPIQRNDDEIGITKHLIEHLNSSLNSSLLVAQPDNLHIPPTPPGVMYREPVTQSRAMPSIANLFPVDAAKKARRYRARRAKAKQGKGSPAASSTSSSDRKLGISTLSDITMDAASDQAVRSSRNTNSRSSALIAAI